MSKKIIGVTVGSPLPKPNLKQTDPSKGDYVKGKDIIPTKLSQLENDSGFVTGENIGSAIHIGSEPPEDENVTVWIDTDEEPEASGGAQADWNASEGEPGHVLNRPFYVTGTQPKTLFDATITISNNQWIGTGTIPLVEGNTYTGIWNGTAYECECYTATLYGMEFICIGNPGILQTGENNDIPFVFGYTPSEGMSAAAAMVDGEYTLKITEEFDVYEPVPESALPSIAVPKVITLPAGALENTSAMLMLYPKSATISSVSFDEFAEHLVRGGDLIIDFSNVITHTISGSFISPLRKVIDWTFVGADTALEFVLIVTSPIFTTSGDTDRWLPEYTKLTFDTGTWRP